MERDFLEVAFIHWKCAHNMLRELVIESSPILKPRPLFQWEGDSSSVKWNDFRLVVPALLLFYQGLEVFLRGCALQRGEQNSGMSIKELATQLIEETGGETYLESVVSRHLIAADSQSAEDSIIARIVSENPQLELAEDLYRLLIEPVFLYNEGRVLVQYPVLECRQSEMISYLKKLCQDIDILFREAPGYSVMLSEKQDNNKSGDI